ncbi:MAG TPA: RsmE family RNA methyltransferase [Puia sp.]|nr:RsmE family RNA methyltransferase [Puia sp.]
MLPYFYIHAYEKGQPEIILDEDNSRHIVQVLRMGAGEPLRLTDGKGALLEGLILDAHKKKCIVRLQHSEYHPAPERKSCIAISLLKNASRFEWFLEKVTEIGIATIIPLLCERTEKQHFRQDRMQNILVSAMLQSQQSWLPELRSPAPFIHTVENAGQQHRFIAHCLEEERISLADISSADPGLLAHAPTQGSTAVQQASASDGNDPIILIGPEGDFSRKEIGLALLHKFLPVTLGKTRLRTETAGIVAATLLQVS